MKGLLQVHFAQCWLWSFHGQVLRLKWDLFVGLAREKNGHRLPLFYPPKKTFDQSSSHGK